LAHNMAIEAVSIDEQMLSSINAYNFVCVVRLRMQILK
jgi:hypothetical protein